MLCKFYCNNIDNMEEICIAHITKEFEDSVCCSTSGMKSNNNFMIQKRSINYKGKPALMNLLKRNAILKVKLLNNIPVSAEIDQNIEIIAIFGYIGDINDAGRTLIIKTYEYDEEIQFQELLGRDNKVLREGTHQS